MDDKQQIKVGGEKKDELILLKKELEKYKKEAREYLNGWKRAKADYINFKNEIEKEKEDLVTLANAGFLVKILPIYDGLKRACLEVGENPDNWAQGILNIKKQFEEFFKNLGIAEIKTVGEKFEPELHDAVDRQKKKGTEPDIVIDEVSGGYKMRDKVILPAKVIVSE